MRQWGCRTKIVLQPPLTTTKNAKMKGTVTPPIFQSSVRQPLLYIGDILNTGNFYFIKDEYYKKFPECGLMGNKDSDEAGVHSMVRRIHPADFRITDRKI